MANGNFGGGVGSTTDPYLVEDAYDLDAIRNKLTAHYKLTSNINLSIPPFSEGEGWVPIGTRSSNVNTRFNGTLNGNGFTISGLYINRPEEQRVGLFGDVYTASRFYDLKIKNAHVTCRSGGILVGELTSSSSAPFQDVYIKGSLS